MLEKQAVRGSGNYSRTRVSTHPGDTRILPGGWTNEQTRAIEIGVGGGFILMTILAVVL